eukprot:332220-Heterocapsa_arctica.AAC.1
MSTVAISVQIRKELRGRGSPHTATMADSKLKMEEECAMELLGSLDIFGGETKKERKLKKRETWASSLEERTVNMDQILAQTEMG